MYIVYGRLYAKIPEEHDIVLNVHLAYDFSQKQRQQRQQPHQHHVSCCIVGIGECELTI